MIERAHVQRVIEKPDPGAEIYERVVGVLVAVDFAGAIAELNRLLDVVIARIDPRRSLGVILRARGRRAAKRPR